MIHIMKLKNIWFIISSVVITTCIGLLIVWGLRYGIDFTGGSLMIINFPKGTPEVSELNKTLNESKLVSYLNIQPAENSKFVFRFNSVGEDQHQAVLSLLKEKFSPDLVEEKFY